MWYIVHLDLAAKENSITHAAAATSNLDPAIAILSPDIELQNTEELPATASEIAAPKPDLGASQNAPKQKKHGFEALK